MADHTNPPKTTSEHPGTVPTSLHGANPEAPAAASTMRSPFLYPQPEDLLSADAESFVLDKSLRENFQSGEWQSKYAPAAPEAVPEEPGQIDSDAARPRLAPKYDSSQGVTPLTEQYSSPLAIEADPEEYFDSSDGEDEETVHCEGLPSSGLRLDARYYQSRKFAQGVLELLLSELEVPGWSEVLSNAKDIHNNLGNDAKNTNNEGIAENDQFKRDILAFLPELSIFKISGALTNAVFFVSLPRIFSVPTVLLRVYGPSSGALISRKKELHILHTLSSKYGIGPLVLGTFGNGRVEEHFNSRALTKEDLRNPVLSRWIARRMRELHSVSTEAMLPPDDPTRSSLYRISHSRSKGSTCSLQSMDSNVSSSAFSLNSGPGPSPALSATYGGTPVRRLSLASTGSGSFRPPPGINEGEAVRKRRRSKASRSTSRLGSKGHSRSRSPSAAAPSGDGSVVSGELDRLTTEPKAMTAGESHALESLQKLKLTSGEGRTSRRKNRREALCAWDNLSRWSVLALEALDKIKVLAPFANKVEEARTNNKSSLAPSWWNTPSELYSFLDIMDLPSLVRDMKAYKDWIIDQDVVRGGGYGSKVVFAHNDTQYGNVLLAAKEDWDEKIRIRPRQAHERIAVIDFEYAGANPRAFDIANHFCEWQTDYHHEEYSFSLSLHGPFPTAAERFSFYRAYLGSDNGQDPDEGNVKTKDTDSLQDLPPDQLSFLVKLDEEIMQWKPMSDGIWCLWAIIQASQDIIFRIEHWLTLRSQANGGAPDTFTCAQEEEEYYKTDFPDIEFDYLSYALDRGTLFRNRQPPPTATNTT